MYLSLPCSLLKKGRGGFILHFRPSSLVSVFQVLVQLAERAKLEVYVITREGTGILMRFRINIGKTGKQSVFPNTLNDKSKVNVNIES